MTIEVLKKQLTAARSRGDLAEITWLYFQLPLSERNEPVTAAGRGHWGGTATLRPSGRPARVTASASGPVQHTPLVSLVLMSTWERSRLVEYASKSEDDRLETGGFLFGHIGKDAIEVTNVSMSDDNRAPDSMVLRGDEAKFLEESWGGIVGTWHTHPGVGEGYGKFSERDLETWEHYLELDGNQYSANLILTPSRDARWPWTPPTITAWIMRRKGNGEIDCSRGFVREVDQI